MSKLWTDLCLGNFSHATRLLDVGGFTKEMHMLLDASVLVIFPFYPLPQPDWSVAGTFQPGCVGRDVNFQVGVYLSGSSDDADHSCLRTNTSLKPSMTL